MANRRPSSLKRWMSSTVVIGASPPGRCRWPGQRRPDLFRRARVEPGFERQLERGQPENTINALDERARLTSGGPERGQVTLDGCRVAAPDWSNQRRWKPCRAEVREYALHQRQQVRQRLLARPARS